MPFPDNRSLKENSFALYKKGNFFIFFVYHLTFIYKNVFIYRSGSVSNSDTSLRAGDKIETDKTDIVTVNHSNSTENFLHENILIKQSKKKWNTRDDVLQCKQKVQLISPEESYPN